MNAKMSRGFLLFGLALVAPSVTACTFRSDPPYRHDHGHGHDKSIVSPDDQPSGGGGGGSSSNPDPSGVAPMLVEVDTDQTMSAEGGQGVGVFVEYASGGHWHLWWTCDTLQTQQSCDFVVSAVAASGNLRNVDSSEVNRGSVTSPSASRVDAKTTTTTEVHGIRFDTDPGEVITVEASVGGLTDGAFLFFVQAGKVNGGFSGKLTNPLQFQGSTP
ncbi:MAG TPA: hypothetical protein VM580_26165 [Labilithrix sp.]|nr:hypothetical protein [Labilithrix sp.]